MTTKQICIALEGNTVDRASEKNGKGWCENVSPTLNTQDRHAICFQLCGDRANPSVSVNDKAYCIPANPISDRGQMFMLNTIERHSVWYSVDCRNLYMNEQVSGTLQAKNEGGHSLNFINPILRKL